MKIYVIVDVNKGKSTWISTNKVEDADTFCQRCERHFRSPSVNVATPTVNLPISAAAVVTPKRN